MNFDELFDATLNYANTLKEAWPIKLAASFLISFFASRAGTIILIFFGLVFFDLFTKWLALTKAYLDSTSAEYKSLWACFWNMRKARAAGYIQSAPMKHRFAGKFLWYMVVCFVAILLDKNMIALGNTPSFVQLFVIYMGLSESLSVLENLKDAGVEQAGDLLEIIKSKRKGLR